MNARQQKSKSGIRGVYLMPNGKYQVSINIDKKQHYLGCYKNIRDAELRFLKKGTNYKDVGKKERQQKQVPELSKLVDEKYKALKRDIIWPDQTSEEFRKFIWAL